MVTKGGKNHVFRCEREDGSPVHFQVSPRLEFQDGTRFAPTQTYHGSGRPHLHVLGFGNLEDHQRLHVAEFNHEATERYCQGSQMDQHCKSGLPVELGDTRFHTDGLLRIHHDLASYNKGHR